MVADTDAVVVSVEATEALDASSVEDYAAAAGVEVAPSGSSGHRFSEPHLAPPADMPSYSYSIHSPDSAAHAQPTADSQAPELLLCPASVPELEAFLESEVAATMKGLDLTSNGCRYTVTDLLLARVAERCPALSSLMLG